MFQHALESHLRDVYKVFRKNYISGFDTNRSFKWFNTLSLMKELFIEVSTVHRSHLVIFIFLQGKLYVSAPVSKSLAWTMFPCDEKIFRMVVFAP